jgi:hypothetical protein
MYLHQPKNFDDPVERGSLDRSRFLQGEASKLIESLGEDAQSFLSDLSARQFFESGISSVEQLQEGQKIWLINDFEAYQITVVSYLKLESDNGHRLATVHGLKSLILDDHGRVFIMGTIELNLPIQRIHNNRFIDGAMWQIKGPRPKG